MDSLPDEDKKREMLVLLSASRAVEAQQAASTKPSKNKTPSSSPTDTPTSRESKKMLPLEVPSTDAEGSQGPAAVNGAGATAFAHPLRSSSPDTWPGIRPEQNTSKQNESAGGKSNKSTANGLAKKNASAASSSSPGSASTWLKAMNRAGTGAGGKTGISVVRPRGGANTTSKAENSVTAFESGRARSESPPPGFVVRRKGDDDGYTGGGIGDAGASWASQGGSGFKGSGKAATKGPPKVSRDDFPGLPGASGGTAAGPAPPRIDPSGGRIEGRPVDFFARSSTGFQAAAQPRRSLAPSSEFDFPELPMPAQARPGLERVDWGISGIGGAQKGGGEAVSNRSPGGSAAMSGGDGVENGGGGKGAKKKNKQKAEKDALKGMAFGFR